VDSGHRDGSLRGAAGILPAGRMVAADHRDPAAKETDLLKQATKQATPGAAATADRSPELWAFFRGELVPLREANINVMTHGFNYGTGVFEGIRAYWNAEQEQLYALDLLLHYERLLRSARLLLMELRHTAQDLADATVEMLRRDGLREDVYVRPIVYKSSEIIGVRLHNLDCDVTIFGVPFGQYIDTEGGIRAQVSSWRRTDDNAIPARGKITGAYVNGALAKSEVTDNILEGITRSRLMAIARSRGIEVVERSIDRTELYSAAEVFLCGTGAQLSPVVEIDRRQIATGRPGPITRALSSTYFDAVRGRLDEYRDWLTPVY
jgi:branched-chain amino acid aminotransferase